MKMLLTLVTALALAAPAIAQDTPPPAAYTLEMWNVDPADKKRRMVFSDEAIAVEAGASVTWLATDRGHNVEFVAGPEGAVLPEKSKVGVDVTVVFDQPGVYIYVCTPHASMGMIGVVIVGQPTEGEIAAAVANAEFRGKTATKLEELLAESN